MIRAWLPFFVAVMLLSGTRVPAADGGSPDTWQTDVAAGRRHWAFQKPEIGRAHV